MSSRASAANLKALLLRQITEGPCERKPQQGEITGRIAKGSIRTAADLRADALEVAGVVTVQEPPAARFAW